MSDNQAQVYLSEASRVPIRWLRILLAECAWIFARLGWMNFDANGMERFRLWEIEWGMGSIECPMMRLIRVALLENPTSWQSPGSL